MYMKKVDCSDEESKYRKRLRKPKISTSVYSNCSFELSFSSEIFVLRVSMEKTKVQNRSWNSRIQNVEKISFVVCVGNSRRLQKLPLPLLRRLNGRQRILIIVCDGYSTSHSYTVYTIFGCSGGVNIELLAPADKKPGSCRARVYWIGTLYALDTQFSCGRHANNLSTHNTILL